MTTESITIARADLSAKVSRALIDALNAELSGIYPEAGATHFRLDGEKVTGGRGAFLIVYQEGTPVGCGALRLIDSETGELKRSQQPVAADVRRRIRSPAQSIRLSMTPERRAPARQVTLQLDLAERELGAPAASWPRGPACRRRFVLTSAAMNRGGSV